MCIKNDIHDSLIKHPIRKTRTKTRKPKFLSLDSMSPKQQQQQQQLNLFPLHPENHVEDRDCVNDENVAFIFNQDHLSNTCSLHSFLPNYTNRISLSSEDDSLNFAYSEADSTSLVRTAMRSRERDAIDEKWVCYSEVVEKKEPLEVTSLLKKKKQTARRQLLSLKLDYQGILNAWSDKAPLYIQGETPQTVPNLQDDDQTLHFDSVANGTMDGWGTEGNVWKVPEMGVENEDLEAKESWKLAQREASVLRYKEKRQSRLFSKRIRYEVRKLNAEKRPRMKGRFVKRS